MSEKTPLAAPARSNRKVESREEKPRVRLSQQAIVATAADRSPAMTVFYREDVHLTGPFAREIAARKKAYERLFEKIVEEGISLGRFRSDIDPKIATFGILGMCNWLSQWYRAGGAYNPQQIAQFFSQLAEFGLATPDSNPLAETNL